MALTGSWEFISHHIEDVQLRKFLLSAFIGFVADYMALTGGWEFISHHIEDVQLRKFLLFLIGSQPFNLQ